MAQWFDHDGLRALRAVAAGVGGGPDDVIGAEWQVDGQRRTAGQRWLWIIVVLDGDSGLGVMVRASGVGGDREQGRTGDRGRRLILDKGGVQCFGSIHDDGERVVVLATGRDIAAPAGEINAGCGGGGDGHRGAGCAESVGRIEAARPDGVQREHMAQWFDHDVLRALRAVAAGVGSGPDNGVLTQAEWFGDRGMAADRDQTAAIVADMRTGTCIDSLSGDIGDQGEIGRAGDIRWGGIGQADGLQGLTRIATRILADPGTHDGGGGPAVGQDSIGKGHAEG